MEKKKYNIIDLFCGCGGISQGYFQTGRVNIIGAIDFNQAACDTYKLNFPTANVICCDITKQTVEESNFKNVDIIVGGPPCQGFSALNRHNKNLEDDPRNVLFLQFIRFVKEISPKAIMIENVRQILTQKDGYARKTICKMLDDLGYNVSYQVLNAADFGVPQKRMRAFFVGIKKEIGKFDFQVINKYRVSKLTTVDDAIGDLYRVENTKVDNKTIYEVDGEYGNDYLTKMHDGSGLVYNHFIKYPNAIVQKRISYVPSGGNWKNVPERLFPSKRNNRHSNYMKRLDRTGQSITIDTGHDVYFHPIYNRVPTVRESARIQSFPDSFHFSGTRNEQLRQVGNAVPPMLAQTVAKGIIEVLDDEK